MMSEKDELFALLDQPTEFKTVAPADSDTALFSGGLSEEFLQEEPTVKIREEDKEVFNPYQLAEEQAEEEEFDAEVYQEEFEEDETTPEESAQTIVTFAELLNVGLIPLADMKLKKKFHIKENAENLAQVLAKQFAGKELEEKEEFLIGQFEQYKESLELLKKDIPFTSDEKQRILNEAKRMAIKRGWKVPAELGFGAVLLESFGSRIMNILTA